MLPMSYFVDSSLRFIIRAVNGLGHLYLLTVSISDIPS